ncbi:MAG: MASE1 domain-containing protein [Fibrobacteres bacterium]|nr:MASE1 domain-containing protein [Fibrobacterota bacterium]
MRFNNMHRLRQAAILASLTGVYYLAGRYGLSLATLNSSASPVWPPTGLALAAMVLLGRWVWPSVLVGAFLVNMSASGDWAASLLIAGGNSLEALAGAWMAVRFCAGRDAFDTIPNICKFALGPGMMATTLSAGVGTGVLLMRGLATYDLAPRVWFTWWMGDTISAWVLAPFLILVGRRVSFRLNRIRLAEGLALATGLFLAGQAAFGGWLPVGQRNLPLEYLGLPFLIWACYRFGQRGAAAAVMLLGAIAVTGNLRGYGPFALRDQNTSLLLLQAFLGTVSLTGLILATALSLKRSALRRMAVLVEEAHAANEKLRHAEEHIRQTQKMEAVGRLAGGVAHDFNNLLTAINGYSEVVLARLPAEDPNRAFVEEIRKAGDRAALVTQQLLAFSRKQVIVPSVLDLNAVILDLEKMLSRLIDPSIEFKVETGSIGKVKADPGQVAQVVMNLVLNGRDAMPSGGVLSIATRNAEVTGRESDFHLKPEPGSYVCVEVRDSGIGMDMTVKDRLFEPFFSTKQNGAAAGKGTGLGLSTVYGIMEQSKGGLKVASEEGRGASFIAYFPRCVEDWTGRAPGRIETTAPGRPSETVLVVEDEDNVRNLVRQVLEAQGYMVLEASGAREALYMYENHSGRLDLLLTDIVLSGKSGRELAKELRELNPGLRVVFMSGYTDDEVVRGGVGTPQSLFLAKPFSHGQLTHIVRSALEGAKAPAEAPV